MICSFCIVAQRRGFVKLLQRNSNKTATIWARKKASPSGEAARRSRLMSKVCQRCRSREFVGSPPASGPAGPPSPEGEGSDCRKRCVYPLAPSARGSCGRWGEELYGNPKYFGLWREFSPSAPAGTSLAEGGFSTRCAFFEESLNRSISPLAAPEMRYNTQSYCVRLCPNGMEQAHGTENKKEL